MTDSRVKICPRCQVRFFMSPGNNDFEHECNSGNLVLDQEDVHQIQTTATDYTGTTTMMLGDIIGQGLKNKLNGTRAGIEGNRLGEFTRRGNKAENTRQRQHINFFENGTN